MPRLSFQSQEEAASFAAAIGFGEDFFGSGQLTSLVEQYKTERGLDAADVGVEITLQDRERLLVTHVRVAKRYLIFYTDDDERVCVPHSEVVKIRIGPSVKPRSPGQTGFGVDRIDEPNDSSS